jgi:decaprenyl-phosphate phosphoribosyltransferase
MTDAGSTQTVGTAAGPLPVPELITLLRPKQWIKNAFVAVPLLLTPGAQSWITAGHTLLGILAFCAVASSVYILNDYMDREADREHPSKSTRPLAAGTVSTPLAFGALGVLLAGGLGLGLWLSPAFALLVGCYFAINLAYSLGLKDVAIVDVLIIALGFVLRVEAGAVIIEVTATVWLTVMTGLLALFIALAKRRDDLVLRLSTDHRSSLDGYNKAFLDNAVTVVLGTLLVVYVIYTTDSEVAARANTDRLVYTTPFVAAGILRYLQIMFVEERSGDPTELVLTDLGLMGAIAGWALVFGFMLYA